MKHHILSVFLSAFMLFNAQAQNIDSLVVIPPEPPNTGGDFFCVAEPLPQFPGGEEAMYAFIKKNLIYPPLAKYHGLEGKVYVQFIVDTTGNLQNIKLFRNPGLGLGEEVIRIIRLMPAWTPGKVKGKPVNVRLVLPVNFKLNESSKNFPDFNNRNWIVKEEYDVDIIQEGSGEISNRKMIYFHYNAYNKNGKKIGTTITEGNEPQKYTVHEKSKIPKKVRMALEKEAVGSTFFIRVSDDKGKPKNYYLIKIFSMK